MAKLGATSTGVPCVCARPVDLGQVAGGEPGRTDDHRHPSPHAGEHVVPDGGRRGEVDHHIDAAAIQGFDQTRERTVRRATSSVDGALDGCTRLRRCRRARGSTTATNSELLVGLAQPPHVDAAHAPQGAGHGYPGVRCRADISLSRLKSGQAVVRHDAREQRSHPQPMPTTDSRPAGRPPRPAPAPPRS